MDKIAVRLPDLASIAKARTNLDVFKYARTKIPNISDEEIQQNLCEIIDAQDTEKKCGCCCLGVDMCPELLNTAGYTYVMSLQPNGRIKVEYAPCEFNGGKKREVLVSTKKTEYIQLAL